MLGCLVCHASDIYTNPTEKVLNYAKLIKFNQ